MGDDDDIRNDEVNEIIQLRAEYIQRHYPSIRDSYRNSYDWPQFDPLRHEICLSIMFGMCQAAITLTNHLLESLLKYALIIKKGNEFQQTEDAIKGRGITSFEEKYADGIRLYGGVNLYDSINHVRQEHLISDEQHQQLHEYRDIFRNAYGHADKKKTFGKSTMPVTGMRLEDDKVVKDESKNAEIASLLIGQGLAQAQIAHDIAPPYFLYIDSLVREIYTKLFGPHPDQAREGEQ